MTAARIASRGWLQQLRAGLPDQTATTIALTVGFLLVAVIAGLAFGPKAVDVVLAAIVCWLLHDRAQLHDRCDDSSDTADQAHERIDRLVNELHGPPSTGRHASRKDRAA